MIQGRHRPPRGQARRSARGTQLKDDRFRRQILLAMALGVIGSLLLFLLPSYYFISQNYQIFVRLASDVRPGLMSHLERELGWLFLFMSVGAVSVVGVTWAFAARLSRGLLEPVHRLEHRLQELASGEWFHADEELPGEHDYRPLVITFNDLNRSLHEKTKNELQILEKLNVDPARREAHALWLSLIERKRNSLGLEAPKKSNEISSESSEAEPWRRVS